VVINDLYRFWLDIPGVGIVQAYPFNSQLKWVDKRKTGYRFYQRTLESKLIFKDDPKNSINDFTKLFNLERSGMTCTKVPITIDKYCECDNTWTTAFYAGYLRLNAGDWDVSNCSLEIPIVVQDPFTCITESWNNEVNMFDYGDPVVDTSPFVGVIMQAECDYDHTMSWQPPPPSNTMVGAIQSYVWNHLADDCITAGEGWTLIQHTYKAKVDIDLNDGLFDGPPEFTWTINVKSKYAREYVIDPLHATEPPGLGWISVPTGWARALNITQGPFYDHNTTEGRAAIAEYWGTDDFSIGFLSKWNILGLDANGNSTLGNGKELGPLLDSILEPCGLTVVSNFFNINPDGTQPDNDYYDRAAVDFSDIVLYQISDIARIDETQSATVALIKLKGILDAMKTVGNCDIEIDGTYLRIEHLSYWPNTVQMDLTQAEFLYLIEEKWKYTYDQEAQPKEEIIAWDSETDKRGGDFDGYPIEYDNTCVNDQESKAPKTIAAQGFLSNIRFVIGNEDYYDAADLIMMVSTTNLVINSATQPISGRNVLNGNLAMGYLIPRYYDYGRPFKTGSINKVSTPFFRILRNKLQAPITIPFSCDDYRDNYTPSGLIKTQLGACEIETATYTDPDGQMELKLRGK
jgi:hypothetical protein